MKCDNCGAPIHMNQKFCPNCGSPNIEFKKHIDDMERYNKKFNSTRYKVIGNSKWFVKYIAPITALVISIIASALAIVGRETMIGYDIARKKQNSYYNSHRDEIQPKLRKLLEDGDYTTLYIMSREGECELTEKDDKYAWNDFYNIAMQYVQLRKGITSMVEKDNSLYNNDDYYNVIASAAEGIEEVYTRCFNTSYHSVSEESAVYIKDIYEKSHEILKAYCGLTDEDVSRLSDMTQAEILTLITRRSFE